MFAPLHVLLTGAFGNVGTPTLDALLRQGHRVTCLEVSNPDTTRRARELVGRAVATEWIDLTDADAVGAMMPRVFSSSTSQLTVRNTNVNLDIIEQIVDAINSTEPLVIQVEVRLITATQENLEELDFDWKLQPINVKNELYLGGGTTGNGQPIVDLEPVHE